MGLYCQMVIELVIDQYSPCRLFSCRLWYKVVHTIPLKAGIPPRHKQHDRWSACSQHYIDQWCARLGTLVNYLLLRLVWEEYYLVQSFGEYQKYARCVLCIHQTECCCRKDCLFCLLEVARVMQEVHLQVVLVLEQVSLVTHRVQKVQRLATDCTLDKNWQYCIE